MQVYTARIGYKVTHYINMAHGSYSLCLTDVKCGGREDVMNTELVYKEGNTTEYDPATHVHMHRAKVKYRCSPGSLMLNHPTLGDISEVDTTCLWNNNIQQVNLIVLAFHMICATVLYIQGDPFPRGPGLG